MRTSTSGRCGSPEQLLEVVEDQLLLVPDQLQVSRTTAGFDVEQDQVHPGQERLEQAKWIFAAGLEHHVQPGSFGERQKLEQELGVQHRLATGQGHAAAALGVERLIGQYFSQQSLRAPMFADHRQCLTRAGIDACAAVCTGIPAHATIDAIE